MTAKKKDRRTTKVHRGEIPAQAVASSDPYLISMSGQHMGRTFRVKEQVVIGRSEECDVSLDDRNVSRQHAVIKTTGKGFLKLTDLGSTNGTFVNGARVKSRTLKEGDQVKLGPDTSFRVCYRETTDVVMTSKLYEAATRDPLTGTYNKRFFLEEARKGFERAREGDALSILMLDLDDFKAINDTHGHLAGDYVLQSVAEMVMASIRQGSVFARYGGEEFALLMPETPLAEAALLAERIRAKAAGRTYHYKKTPLKATMSIGVAQFCEGSHRRLKDLLAEADEQLYLAKRRGKNRVEPPPPDDRESSR